MRNQLNNIPEGSWHVIGCQWILSQQEFQLHRLPLIFSHVWLPGTVDCQESVCFRNWRVSWEGTHTEWDCQTGLACEEKVVVIWGKAGFDSLVLHPFPSTAPFKCTHIRVLETEQKQRELFSLKTSGLPSCFTLLSTYSSSLERILADPTALGFFLPLNFGGFGWLSPTQSQNLYYLGCLNEVSACLLP